MRGELPWQTGGRRPARASRSPVARARPPSAYRSAMSPGLGPCIGRAQEAVMPSGRPLVPTLPHRTAPVARRSLVGASPRYRRAIEAGTAPDYAAPPAGSSCPAHPRSCRGPRQEQVGRSRRAARGVGSARLALACRRRAGTAAGGRRHTPRTPPTLHVPQAHPGGGSQLDERLLRGMPVRGTRTGTCHRGPRHRTSHLPGVHQRGALARRRGLILLPVPGTALSAPRRVAEAFQGPGRASEPVCKPSPVPPLARRRRSSI